MQTVLEMRKMANKPETQYRFYYKKNAQITKYTIITKITY